MEEGKATGSEMGTDPSTHNPSENTQYTIHPRRRRAIAGALAALVKKRLPRRRAAFIGASTTKAAAHVGFDRFQIN
jgi:hypothetical protein